MFASVYTSLSITFKRTVISYNASIFRASQRFSPASFSPSLQYRKIYLSNSFAIMFNLRQLVVLVIASLALAQNFEWDCTKSLATCNNACFAVNCKGSPSSLTYDSNKANRGPRRTASGCNRTPCTNTHYRSFGNSCDEFPFASTNQGGAGAILRCVDSTENSSKLYNIVLDSDCYNSFRFLR